MINKKILEDLMNDRENQETYKEIISESDMDFDYKGYTYGVILGNIINGILKTKVTDEAKEKRMSEILNVAKEEIMEQFDAEEVKGVAMGLQLVILAEFMQTEEGKDLLDSVLKQKEEVKKEVKSDTYEEYLSSTMNKITNLAGGKFKTQFDSGEVEILDIAMITIASEIKESIETNDQVKLKKTFDNVKVFLKEQFEIDLAQIGKPITTLVNSAAGKTILKFENNKFTITVSKETNTQKVTRSVERLLKLQNM